MNLRGTTRWIPVAALAALATVGPWIAGSPEPPSVAPGTAQFLPPGAAVEEAPLAGGGFVRARRIEALAGGLALESGGERREIAGVRTEGPVRRRRLWLGTDHQGRDLAARLLAGARVSLVAALIATVVSIGVGTAAGLASAMAPAPVGALLRLGTDAALGLPRLLVLLVLAVALRGHAWAAGTAIGLVAWMDVARLVESDAAALRGRPFVAAAGASGAGRFRLALRHLLPNVSPLLWILAPAVAADAVLLETTLAYLGADPSASASWGRMIAEGQRFLPAGGGVALAPGVLVVATALAFHAASGTFAGADRPGWLRGER